ncbi:MAG TPA: ATP-binding protein [Thermoanaerobaculia bacterium]|nr:ATP-binding protein [Thermoanaerobaculia bacterium]
MPLREKIDRHRKDHRLIAAGLVALLLLFTALFYLLQRGRDLPAVLVTNRVLLFVLWYVNVVLILVVLFVLLRNLFKLVIERRHRMLGSNFKLKLVATYIGLSLFPVLALFLIATELLQGSIDRWFNTPVGPMLERGNAVAQALYDRIEETGLRDAARTLGQVRDVDLEAPEERPALTRRLQALQAETGQDLLAVYEGTDFVTAILKPESGLTDLPEPGRAFLAQAVEKGEAFTTLEPPGVKGTLMLAAVASTGSRASAGEPAGPPAPEEKAKPPVLVVAGTLVDPVLAEQWEKLVQESQAYRQLAVQKDDLRASHLLLFIMMTLLILLASSWVGLYLARRVTIPIQALAEGTRRISSGDLGHRVDVEADDELGVLVSSFNRMTQELESNKELLEQSNRELVKTNQRLADERAMIAAVLENLAAGVISIASDGRIFTCNSAALELLRQRAEEVLRRPFEEAWADPERARLAAFLKETGFAAHAVRELHLLLGGEWKTFDVKVTALRDASGVVQGRVLVLEDLTELIQAQQLAAWNEAARRIAHEIKNPLTPILLSAERMQKKHEQGDPDLGKAVQEGANIIVREVTTLQGMVDEFSRYARMPRPRPTDVDLSRLVSETVHLYRNLKPGVEVEGDVKDGLDRVRIDGEQVKRALINLLDNAVEATDAPGRVTVRACPVNGHLEIQVADTGRGIPPASKEKLFLPYFSTKGRGTGLGLAIVHRIVTDHHGSVRVEDNVPQGTVFTMELPME